MGHGERVHGGPQMLHLGGGGEEPQEWSTGALLSAEHTKFTWDQKTWEDRLIQVEARWGRWGQLCGFGVGGVQEPLGDTFPSCLKTWGAQAAAAGGPSLEAKAPEAAPKPAQHEAGRAERATPLETAEGAGEGGSRLQEHSPLGHCPPVPSSPAPSS